MPAKEKKFEESVKSLPISEKLPQPEASAKAIKSSKTTVASPKHDKLKHVDAVRTKDSAEEEKEDLAKTIIAKPHAGSPFVVVNTQESTETGGNV